MNQPSHQAYGQLPTKTMNRTPFVLAAIGAWLASGYWALLTALIGFTVTSGGVSGTQLLMPCVLIGLYGVRGYQLFQGQPSAINSALWLHGIGAIMGIAQMVSGGPIVWLLQGIKVAIHAFGGLTAYNARRTWLAHLQGA
jgi:hypothetical protein